MISRFTLKLRSKFRLLLFCYGLCLPLLLWGREFPLQKSLRVEKAGVVSAHFLASRAGLEMLQQGGNAADAATATAMALAVVYPRAGNLGGGGFLIYRLHDGRLYLLDFRETAPGAADHDMYLDSTGTVVDQRSRIGALAVGVPGTVRGFYRFHQKYGRLSWKQVLQPAIHYARNGFEVNSYLHRTIASHRDALAQFPSTRAIFLPNGDAPPVGSKLVQSRLARALESLAESGDRVFYEGWIARDIVETVQKYGGIIRLEDLKNYNARERQPIRIKYRDYEIISFPPPSSGGVVLAGILQALQNVRLNRYPFHSPEQISLLAELEKRFFALRNHYLGDPDFVKIPLQKLLNPQLAQRIIAGIQVGRPVPAQNISPQRLLMAESSETTHFSVLDEEGNAVSVTYTLNGSFGSYLTTEESGILLNNEMDDFAAKPGSPNMYGLVQGEANSIAPGKRMLSSMTPTIVTRGGQLEGVLGSPGGPTIITTVLQVLLNKIDYGMTLSEAIEAGRFHHQWLPDKIFYEKNRFPSQSLKTLEQWGYQLVKRNSMGDVEAIWRKGNGWELCSDPRDNGYPTGY